LVFERSLAVGSVPSIQMYSALYGIGTRILRFGRRFRCVTLSAGRF
jgi:hypothetical protein